MTTSFLPGLVLAAAALAGCASTAPLPPVADAGPRLVTRAVEYRHGDEDLEGYLVYDERIDGPRPGVLVVHAWWGLDDFAKDRARELARMGYVAFALDMYGKGKVTDDPKQAGEWAGQFRSAPDPSFRRARTRAGLDVLARQRLVDPTRLGAIGFCFGGTTVLELAWSGADVDAVVSFHGVPTYPSEEEAPGVRAAILVCHGAADPMVKPETLRNLQAALHAAELDWQLVSYGGAVHSFTDPGADAHGFPGVAYQREAAERSWALMGALFAEVYRDR